MRLLPNGLSTNLGHDVAFASEVLIAEGEKGVDYKCCNIFSFVLPFLHFLSTFHCQIIVFLFTYWTLVPHNNTVYPVWLLTPKLPLSSRFHWLLALPSALVLLTPPPRRIDNFPLGGTLSWAQKKEGRWDEIALSGGKGRAHASDKKRLVFVLFLLFSPSLHPSVSSTQRNCYFNGS